MKRLQTYLSVAILLCIIIACEEQKRIQPVEPEILLSKEQMSEILAQMHVVEAIISQSSIPQDSANQIAVNNYAMLYRKYNVDEHDFKNSFDYYRLKPVEMDSIYAGVVTRLNEMETQYGSSAFTKPDSIQGVKLLKK